MSLAQRILICGTLVLMPPVATAHEGHRHEGASAVFEHGPVLSSDGRLYLSKALQRRLGIRTATVDDGTETRRLPAVVSLHPDAAARVDAPEQGRVEAATAWPVPGQWVERGDVLAVLYPSLSGRDKARRRVELAQIEQRLVIARINVSRLRLQVAGADGKVAPGNIYFEQAESELRGLEEALRARLAGLASRQELRSPVAGQVVDVSVAPGQMVEPGGRLFLVAGEGVRRIEVPHADTRLFARFSNAVLTGRPETRLFVRGQESSGEWPGWKLLLDMEPGEAGRPGQIVEIELSMRPALHRCPSDGEPEEHWVHVAPEWFERRLVLDCDPAHVLKPGERRVTKGEALLSNYRERALAAKGF